MGSVRFQVLAGRRQPVVKQGMACQPRLSCVSRCLSITSAPAPWRFA